MGYEVKTPGRLPVFLCLRAAVFSLSFAAIPGASFAADSWPGKKSAIVYGVPLDIARPDGEVEGAFCLQNPGSWTRQSRWRVKMASLMVLFRGAMWPKFWPWADLPAFFGPVNS